MTTKRKIIVYIATSVDGYIARSDGNIDWLNRPMPKDGYGMTEFFKSIDTILWGRKTFGESASRGGPKAFGAKVKNYVFTHQPPKSPTKGVEFINEDIRSFASRLRAEPGKNIWMMGGGGVIASFLDAGEIDEFMIHVVPTFIGEGIPLVQPGYRNLPLKLLATKTWEDGVVLLHYEVQRTATGDQKLKARGQRGNRRNTN